MTQITDTHDRRTSPAEPLLTFQDIAEAADCCLQQVYNWANAGWLESVKIGRMRRVTPDQWARFQARAARGDFQASGKAEKAAAA